MIIQTLIMTDVHEIKFTSIKFCPTFQSQRLSYKNLN